MSENMNLIMAIKNSNLTIHQKADAMQELKSLQSEVEQLNNKLGHAENEVEELREWNNSYATIIENSMIIVADVDKKESIQTIIKNSFEPRPKIKLATLHELNQSK